MRNCLTFEPSGALQAHAVRSRSSIHLAALAERRAQSMRRPMPDTHRPSRRRFDFDAALLALIFAGQFGVMALGVEKAVGEPHVGAPAIVASAPAARAP